MKTVNVFILLALVLFLPLTAVSQTGKIVGTVTDRNTGEPLISANVVIEGTTLGAATNLDGYFVILNVPPGTYSVRGSMIGYTPLTVTNVRVLISQTTEVDLPLSETVFQTEEVVVVASRPIVERDVSGSRSNISSDEIKSLPVSQVSSVVGLQAGVQGMSVRGGSSDQTAFIVNGLTMRDERDNSPYTGISLLAVQDLQIQAGGFNAEYGDVRSGVVTVSTREGSSTKYNVGALVRYSPAQKKYFGMQPNDPNSYWIRPYLDDAVAWTGTNNGAWDEWTRRQYKTFADGWIVISQGTLNDSDPTNDLSPEAAQRVFLWQHRKVFDVTKPDYTADFSLGGPIPFAGKPLGNLRFFATLRLNESQYAIPLSRSAFSDYTGNVKLTSDIAQGMKLMVEGMWGEQWGTDQNNNGAFNVFGGLTDIASSMDRVSFIDTRTFATDYWGPNYVRRFNYGFKFTHVINPSLFYEVVGQWFASRYSTNPGTIRDTTRLYKFGNGYYLDEAPFNFFPSPGNYSTTGIDGMRMAIGMSNARDSSKTDRYALKFDIVGQVDRFNELKGGVEFLYVDTRVNYGSVDVVLPVGRTESKWQSYPTYLGVYIQDKLEFEGMIANLGLRFEVSHAGGEWYVYDSYTSLFKGQQSYGIDTLLQKEPTQRITSLSPRLGIAFPITIDSKLYFNYGHFRQRPLPENLFLVRRQPFSGDVVRVADPNLPLQRTIQYELGYDHNLFDMFLVRLAAYYKDISDQSRLVSYIGYNNVPNYTVTTNTSYEDIRGFELTVQKNRGDWIRGFVNYTYQVSSSGAFGRPTYFQNPVDQRNDERTNPVQFKPIPRPYARLNLDLFTPEEYGPDLGGFYPVGDWRLNLNGSWTAGSYITWVGGGSIPGVIYNLQRRDTWFFDMRIGKSFRLAGATIELFADIYNVFNIKQMSHLGFVDAADYDYYMKSLHLPEEFNQYYDNIPGGDRPGDYRKAGVEYQPMVYASNVNTLANPSTRPIYYDAATRNYYRFANSEWKPVDSAELQQVLDSKAYIDMPNQDWFSFLPPRDVYFGLRFSVDF